MPEKITSIVELLLRLGCTLVAWMVVYTHCLWLATLRVIDCEAGSDEFWRLLLGFSPVTIGFALLLGAMNKVPEIAKLLNWLGLPMIILIPLASLPVFSTLITSTLGELPICNAEYAVWHPWWAPVQLITLAVVIFGIFKARRFPKLPLNQ